MNGSLSIHLGLIKFIAFQCQLATNALSVCIHLKLSLSTYYIVCSRAGEARLFL